LLQRILPFLAFLFTLALGVFTAALVYRSENIAQQARFEQFADEVVDRVRSRMNEYISMMVGVRGFLQTAAPADASTYSNYFYSFGIEESFGGIRAMGFAPVKRQERDANIRVEVLAHFDQNFKTYQETDFDLRVPVVLLEPLLSENKPLVGYDLYSKAANRSAIDRALEASGIQTSGPVILGPDDTDQIERGFVMFLPTSGVRLSATANALPDSTAESRVDGVVYAMFAYDRFLRHAIDEGYSLPVAVRIADVGDGSMSTIFRSDDFEAVAADSDFSSTRQFEFAGRSWEISVHDTETLRPNQSHLGSMVLAVLAFILAVAFFIAARLQQATVESAQRLALFSAETVAEKDLMLQEMKHRIKNHIARIQSIARQTVSTSADLAEFAGSFDSRMRAMAEAQDMLTRSQWQKAELRELANKELRQIFGDAYDESIISGPDIKLDEKQTQALGLIFHELATNAIKYSQGGPDSENVTVKWSVGKDGVVDLLWAEKSLKPMSEPTRVGFGTRLIQANVKYELKGELERQFHESGLNIRIKFPLRSNRKKKRKKAR
jgi:two-component sensor histidine kinase